MKSKPSRPGRPGRPGKSSLENPVIDSESTEKSDNYWYVKLLGLQDIIMARFIVKEEFMDKAIGEAEKLIDRRLYPESRYHLEAVPIEWKGNVLTIDS